MSVLNGTYYASTDLDVAAKAGAKLYQRQTVNTIGATADDATDLGTLTTNKTALNVIGKVCRENSKDYYSFTLDGDSLKMDFNNTTDSADMRVQLIDSEGNVVADNEGTDDQQTAYDDLTSDDGLDADAGTYTVRVSYGSTALKSVAQSYTLSLYSGTKFNDVYQTQASTQTTLNQKVLVDNTMSYALSDAQDYSTDAVMRANSSASNTINIGWIYENKSALSVTGMLTSNVDEQYFSFMLQKGETLKMALNNTTAAKDEEDIRVQVYDATGTCLYADSDGTDEQKAAYEKLISSDGLSLESGATYVIKLSYEQGAEKGHNQSYKFNLYSGTTYSGLYETSCKNESFDASLLNGTLEQDYNSMTQLAAYMSDVSNGEDTNIFSIMSKYV